MTIAAFDLSWWQTFFAGLGGAGALVAAAGAIWALIYFRRQTEVMKEALAQTTAQAHEDRERYQADLNRARAEEHRVVRPQIRASWGNGPASATSSPMQLSFIGGSPVYEVNFYVVMEQAGDEVTCQPAFFPVLAAQQVVVLLHFQDDQSAGARGRLVARFTDSLGALTEWAQLIVFSRRQLGSGTLLQADPVGPPATYDAE